MIIIISPSKTFTNNFIKGESEPLMTTKTKYLYKLLKEYSVDDFKLKFNLSDNLSLSTYYYYKSFNNMYKCVYLYGGTAFKYLDAINIDEKKLTNLYILSAYYGLLNALDNINYYRLDIKDKLLDISLKDYWYNDINNELLNKKEIIINLSSGEYSSLLDLNNKNIYSIDFREVKNNKLVGSSMTLKKLRGLMANYILVNDVKDIKNIKKISLEGFTYNELYSKDNLLMFVKE